MDRQTPTHVESQEGHKVRSPFRFSIPISRAFGGNSPTLLLSKTAPAQPSTTPAVATAGETASFALMTQPRQYPASIAQPSITTTLNPSRPTSGLEQHSTPINVPQAKWDNSQQTLSATISRPQSYMASAGLSSVLNKHQKSASYDYGYQSSNVQEPEKQDPHDFFTPRMPVYDANTFARMGAPPAPLSNDFNTMSPPDEVDPWVAAQAGLTRSPPKRGRGKKADGKQATFLTKLYALLEDPEHQHILRWDETGELIVIERPDELAANILPILFRQSRFASFSRQLNIYGWMRKVSLRHVGNGTEDPDASTWAHNTLRRDSPKEEIQGYKRRVPPRPSQAQKRMQNDLLSSVSSDSDSFNSPPDPTTMLQDIDDGQNMTFATSQLQSQSRVAPALQQYGSSAQASPSRNKNSMYLPAEDLSGRRLSYPPMVRPGMGPQRPGDVYRASTYPALTGISGDMSGNFHPSSLPLASYMPMPSNSLQFMQEGFQADLFGFNTSSTSFGALAISDEQKDEDLLLRGTNDVPAYLLNDASTWQRSGYGIIGNGLRPSEPAPLVPSSLPSNFQSFYHQPTFVQQQQTMPMAETSMQGQKPQQTVSPGVYQSGFAINSWNSPASTPSPPVGHPPMTPPILATRVPSSPTVTKQGRRLSASKAPYSPPNTRNLPTPTGVIRTIDGRRNSISQVSAARPDNDDGLPSASLSGQPELFGGELNRSTMNDSL